MQVLKYDYYHMQNVIFGENIQFDTISDGIEKLEKEMNSIRQNEGNTYEI